MSTRTREVQVTVWYDGGCPLCLREMALMRRLDRAGAVAFIDARGGGAACPLAPAALLARFHAREGSGPMLSGAAAFAALWRALPALRPLGVAARHPVVLAGLERLYLAFLRARPALQRLLRSRGT